jgi:hypothetical protein
MNWIVALEPYFRGEKLEALVFILPLGLASLVFGAWLLTDGDDAHARGVAWPFLVLGLALTVTGATVGFRTPTQVASIQRDLAAEPSRARAAEAKRMVGVNRAWPIYLAAWATFAVCGLALRFLARHDLAHGVGAALVFFAGVGLLIDGFAERRARAYTATLEAAAAPTDEAPPLP